MTSFAEINDILSIIFSNIGNFHKIIENNNQVIVNYCESKFDEIDQIIESKLLTFNKDVNSRIIEYEKNVNFIIQNNIDIINTIESIENRFSNINDKLSTDPEVDLEINFQEKLNIFEAKINNISNFQEKLNIFEAKINDISNFQEKLNIFEAKINDISNFQEKLNMFEAKINDISNFQEKLNIFEAKLNDISTQEKLNIPENTDTKTKSIPHTNIKPKKNPKIKTHIKNQNADDDILDIRVNTLHEKIDIIENKIGEINKKYEKQNIIIGNEQYFLNEKINNMDDRFNEYYKKNEVIKNLTDKKYDFLILRFENIDKKIESIRNFV